MALIFLDNTSGFAVSLAKQTSNLRLKIHYNNGP
jgi:hypothetical protein